MSSKMVSVVIPTYNKSLSIESTLRSVLQQTYKHVEIILVDNGSTDGTREVINKFIAANPNNWKIIDAEENLGPSNARNLGILNSTGKYIFFLDGDDVFLPTKIEVQVKFMEENHSVGLSITPFFIYSNSYGPIRVIKNLNPARLISGWLNMTGFGGLVESTGCIRKSFLDSKLIYDISLMGSEGLDFTKNWSERYEIAIIPNVFTIYRLSENQLHRDTKAIKENMFRLADKFIADPKEKSHLIRLQSEFFYLDSLRTSSLISIAAHLINSLLLFNYPRVRMMFSIFGRNIKALALGLKYREYVNECLKRVE
jgi:glycosyltransferase involved in cell wall biosynthesis